MREPRKVAVCTIAEHSLGSLIPAGDDTFQGLADNSVFGRVDYGREHSLLLDGVGMTDV